MALALTFDKAAATAVAANASDGDQALQRKLWLAIARHLIMATNHGTDNDPVRISRRSHAFGIALSLCPQGLRWWRDAGVFRRRSELQLWWKSWVRQKGRFA